MSWIDKLRSSGARRSRRPKAASDDATRRFAAPSDPSTAANSAETHFPRFHSSASDQIDHRGDDPLSALRVRLRSACTPAQPITNRRMFAGRTKVLTSLIRSIEDQRLHTFIYGERGLGKTSLLHVLAQAARDARYLVDYVTCGASLD